MRNLFIFLIVLVSVPMVLGGECTISWLQNHTISYWKLEENAKPYNDTRNNINFPYGDDPVQIAGKLDFGQDFEETNTDWLNSSRDSNINRTMGNTNGFTYNFWIKPELVDGTETFLSTYYPSASTNGFYFSYLNTGYFDLIGYNGTVASSFRSTSQGTKKVKTGNWQMITITYSRNVTAGTGQQRQLASYLDVWLNSSKITDFATHKGGYFSNATTVNYALTVGEIGYESNPLDGILDELSFFDRQLNATCIAFLYNLGAPTATQQFPYTTASAPTITVVYPNSTKHYGYSDLYNGSIILTSDKVANCTLNDTRWDISKTYSNSFKFTNNSVIGEGNYSIQYRCNSSATAWTNSSFYLAIDLTYPIAYINWPIPNGSRIWELATPRFNVSMFDRFLYRGNITFINSSGVIRWFVQNKTINHATEYRWWNYSKVDLEPNKTYVSKNAPIPWEDVVTIRLQATDDHTASIFAEDVEAKIVAQDGKISTTYELAFADFTQTLPDTFSTKITESTDRWRFEYDIIDEKIPGPTTMIIHSDKQLDYLPDSPYKCHFVIADKYWYDCEGLKDPKVTKIDSQTFQIDFIMDTLKVTTDSIGGLNNITVDYTYILDYSNVSIIGNASDSSTSSITLWFNTSEPANLTYHIGDSCNSSNFSNGSQVSHTLNHTITLGGLTLNTTYWVNISRMWDNVLGLGQSHITTGKNSSCFNITTLATQLWVEAYLTVSGTFLRGWCNATNIGGTSQTINWTVFRNGLPVSNGSVADRLSGVLYNVANYSPTLGGDYIFQCLASNITYWDIDNSTTRSLPIWYLTIYNETDLTVITTTNFTIEIVSMNHNWSTIIVTSGTPQNISNFPYFDEYEIRYYANNYRLRGQYIDLTNAVSSNVSLYALKDNESEYIDVYVQDFGLQGIPDVKVGVWRYYSNISSWIEVAEQPTNILGVSRFYLNKSQAFYKFVLVYNNATVFSTDGEVLHQTQYYIRTDLNPVYTPLGDVNGEMHFINTSSPKKFIFEYADADSTVQQVCLATWEVGRTGYISNQSNCTTAGSGTLTHEITNYEKSYISVPYLRYITGEWGYLAVQASFTGFTQTQRDLRNIGVILTLILICIIGLGITYMTGNFIVPIITLDAVLVGITFLDWFPFINWVTLGIIIPSSIVIAYYINKRV